MEDTIKIMEQISWVFTSFDKKILSLFVAVRIKYHVYAFGLIIQHRSCINGVDDFISSYLFAYDLISKYNYSQYKYLFYKCFVMIYELVTLLQLIYLTTFAHSSSIDNSIRKLSYFLVSPCIVPLQTRIQCKLLC